MSEFSREMLSFIEISQEGSIRKAADKLNVASSALSRQVRILESDLGVQLFLRGARGVQLTNQGRLVLDQAKQWLEDSNQLRTSLAKVEDGNESIARIGAMECFATTLIPELFNFAHSEQLCTRMTIKIGNTGSILECLNKNTIDIAIAFNVLHSQSVRVVSDVQCRIGLVYRSDQYAVEGPEISVADCLDWPICLPGEELSLHPRLYSQILKQRKKPNILSTSSSVEFIRKVVAQGSAVSFLTWFDVRDDVIAGHLNFVPLADKRLTENLCVCVSGVLPQSAPVTKLASQAGVLIDAMYGNG